MKKIIVKAPALSASGYGEQARFALRSLKEHKDLDVYLINIPWGRTGQALLSAEEKSWLQNLLEKTQLYSSQTGGKLHFDLSLQITVPNEFEKIADFNIGYTAGIETTKVSPQWIDKSNQMDKIIVPSNHSKNVFQQTIYKAKNKNTVEETDFKLKTPIEVCAFPAKYMQSEPLELDLPTSFNFLSVAQWGPRKNVPSTVKNFLKEFKDDEDVGLVLKINLSKNSIMDKEETRKRLSKLVLDLKKEIGDYRCKLYLLHGNLTQKEMLGLYQHPKINAFVTTTHGEGFGLPMFEAAISELPIAAPSWSSYVDFLYAPKKDKKTGKVKNKAHFVKIDFELKPVQRDAVWDGVIQADSQWCWVKDHSVRDAMRELFKNHQVHLSSAKKLRTHILETFSEQKQNQIMRECIFKESKEEKEWKEELGVLSEE